MSDLANARAVDLANARAVLEAGGEAQPQVTEDALKPFAARILWGLSDVLKCAACSNGRFPFHNITLSVSYVEALALKAALTAPPSADLLAAAKVGLEAAERELALVLESHCNLGADLEPRRDTLDDDVRDLVEDMESNIAQIRTAIRNAGGE